MKVKQNIVLAGFAFCLAVSQASADPVLRSVVAGAQTPNPITPGETATFPLTVVKSGIGSLDAFLTISQLPAGMTATFAPTVVSFKSDSDSPVRHATLTIVTTVSVQPGSYPFTISASHGNSKTVISTDTTLVVGGSPRVAGRPLLSIEPVTDGVRISGASGPSQLCYIEATSDLGSAAWTRIGTNSTDAGGLFGFVDADAKNYSSRFYRTVTPGN